MPGKIPGVRIATEGAGLAMLDYGSRYDVLAKVTGQHMPMDRRTPGPPPTTWGDPGVPERRATLPSSAYRTPVEKLKTALVFVP